MANVTRIESVPYLPKLNGTLNKRQVAIYARVSTGKDEQHNSLEAQQSYYKDFINKHLNWTLVETYVDDGKTGTAYLRREAFVRMIKDCEAGKINLIVTKSVSRFARNTVDALKHIRKLKEIGVEVYFEKENIWTLDGKGEFLITLMTSFAQEESRSISENTAWGKRKRFAEGYYSVPYSVFLGYDEGFVINQKEAVTIRRIYKLYLMGYSSRKIANILTTEKRVTPTGIGKWRADEVTRILQNEKYKGDALLQKSFKADVLDPRCRKNNGELPRYYVSNGHTPIVEPILFDYVQKRLEERSFSNSGQTIFSDRFICAKCKTAFGPKPEHSNDKYRKVIWMCRNRFKKGLYCKNTRIDERLLGTVYSEIATKIVSRRNIIGLCNNLLAMHGLRDVLVENKGADNYEDIAMIIKRILVYQKENW